MLLCVLAPPPHAPAPHQWLEETRAERKQRIFGQFLIRKRNNEMHSLRSDTEHKLGIARRFRDDVIYYPHTLDFRGRAYPMHPHLNHMGNDLCRGLMTFAEPRPLGARGWHWLMVHLYNVHAGGKQSMDDRVRWSEERLPQVLATARDPLGEVEAEGRWWLKAESPFQCLAVCREIAEIVTTLQPEDYHTYQSRQPVYQVGVLLREAGEKLTKSCIPSKKGGLSLFPAMLLHEFMKIEKPTHCVVLVVAFVHTLFCAGGGFCPHIVLWWWWFLSTHCFVMCAFKGKRMCRAHHPARHGTHIGAYRMDHATACSTMRHLDGTIRVARRSTLCRGHCLLTSTPRLPRRGLVCVFIPSHLGVSSPWCHLVQVVQRRVEEDARDNNPLALVLRNDVDRKLVKQTVMTSVYGVTQIGAAQQVMARLVERGWLDNRFTHRVARYGANVR